MGWVTVNFLMDVFTSSGSSSQSSYGALDWGGASAQITHQVWSQITHQVWPQITHQVWSQITHQVWSQITHQVWSQITHQVSDYIL